MVLLCTEGSFGKPTTQAVLNWAWQTQMPTAMLQAMVSRYRGLQKLCCTSQQKAKRMHESSKMHQTYVELGKAGPACSLTQHSTTYITAETTSALCKFGSLVHQALVSISQVKLPCRSKFVIVTSHSLTSPVYGE